MIFKTIYDIIKYIERKYPQLEIYSSDSFFTDYRIPLDIWKKDVDIPINLISTINKNLDQGEICIWNNKVYLSY